MRSCPRPSSTAAAAAADDRMVEVETVVARMPRARAVALLGPPTDQTRATWVADGPGDVFDVVPEDAGVTTMTAPRLALPSGERGTVLLQNQVAYVSGCQVEVAEDVAIADPVVDVLVEGLELEVTATLTMNGRGVRLELSLDHSEILRPIEEREGVPGLDGAWSPLTIQMPVVDSRAIELGRVVRAGETLVIGWPSLGAADEVDLVLLRASALDALARPGGAVRAAP